MKMMRKDQKINRVLLVISILLISFGSINIATSFGQTSESVNVKCYDQSGNELKYCTKPMDLFIQNILEQLLSTVGPIVAGAVSMAISFARKKGLNISAEAEEYFVNSARSFVENQSRYIFKQFKEQVLLLLEIKYMDCKVN